MSRVCSASAAIRGCGSAAPLPGRALRAAVRLVLWTALRLGMRIRVEGERVPGPAVVVSNHPNVIDGPLALMADPTMRPVARWHRSALVRVALWATDCLITTTGTPVTPHRGAFNAALAHLRAGGRVWIAPEGGWQPTLDLRPPRTGAVRLAAAAGVPIQILSIHHDPHPGPDFRRWRPWPRPRVVLRWGPCITASGDVEADIDTLMRTLAAAAGARWRGTVRARDSFRA